MSYEFNNMTSGFWMGDQGIAHLEEKSSVGKLVELSKYHKAIKNFVSILTEQDIPVEFQGNDSYTDGKRITITSNIKHTEFDSVVGLALHEGSHIKLSDFEGLKQIMDGSHPKVQAMGDGVELWLLKNLLNIIEDRRIDHYVFTTCPGYEGYYKALYEKYFESKIIDKALLSSEHRDETVDSYLFRICNFINANRDLDALKGLREIWQTINLGKIDRLKSSEDALDVSIEVYNIIMKYVSQEQQGEGEGDGEGSEGESQEGDDSQKGSSSSGSKGEDDGKGSDDGTGSEASDDGDGENDGSGEETPSASSSTAQGNKSGEGELSDRQKKQLAKAIEKQKDFLDNNIKKTKLNKADQKKMEQLTKAGVESGEVGEGSFTTPYGKPLEGKTVPAIIVKNFNKQLVDNNLFPQLAKTKYDGGGVISQEVIDQGLLMGTMLGKKMRTRQESNQLETTRLKSGKIDKRLLSGVGYGVTEVFKKIEQQNFKPAYIHISIDASGSMSGEKWENSLKVAIAVAKAASMIQGLHCVISTRGDNHTGPVTLIAYDSKKDKIGKIKTLFKYLFWGSTTPEGLSFESILKYIEETNNGQDSYFINISDGAPWWSGRGIEYYGRHAENHTKKQVDAMRTKGVKVLSYFVTNSYDTNIGSFKAMYGKDAETINMSNVGQIARTMNKLLMKK